MYSKEEYERMATSNDYICRCSVASDSNTPIAILQILASDDWYIVRDAVYTNKNCTDKIKKLIKAWNFLYHEMYSGNL
jgi:hypothetical protein